MARLRKAHEISVLRTEMVPLTDLHTFKKNPRVGNIDAIAKSLKTFGQFKPIVANLRDKSVLAGNHTYLGARKIGSKDILVSWVDVDEDIAKAIVLADNKTSDMGTYDDHLLGELLRDAGIKLVEATGYSQHEFDTLTGLVQGEADAAVERLQDVYPGIDLPDPDADVTDIADTDFGEENDSVVPTEVVDTTDYFQKAADTLPGIVKLERFPVFDGWGEWGLPKLRPDMFVTADELPGNIKTWAGSASRDELDPDVTWFYNYGIDSTSGMKDVSKQILAFYTYEDYFDNWWWFPDKYVSKMLNTGIKYAVMPDFNAVTDDNVAPRFFDLYALYKNLYLTRYMQEAGIKMIPHVTWSKNDDTFRRKYALKAIPGGGVAEVASFQMHTMQKNVETDPAFRKQLAGEYREVHDHIQPKKIIAYVNKYGRMVLDELQDLPVQWIILDNRNTILGQKRKKVNPDVEVEPRKRSGAGI